MTETRIRLVSAKQVASLLGVSVRTVTNWVAKGKFPPPAKIFGYPRWKEEDVLKYVEKQFAEARR